MAFYSDKHAVFRVNQTGAIGGDDPTQFGRALHALNIDILYANRSQAKGRVERMNKTLQDRLVKELRLEGIDTLDAANALGLRRRKVRVHDYPDGTIAIKYEGADLPYSVFDKVRQVKQADIVSNKHLGAVLKHVQEQQQKQAFERSQKAPKRRGQRRIAAERFREVNPAAL